MAILGHVFWSQWKGDKGLNTNVGLLLRYRRRSVYERSAVFPRIPNTLRITFRYSAFHISASHALENPRQPLVAVINTTLELENDYGVPFPAYVNGNIGTQA